MRVIYPICFLLLSLQVVAVSGDLDGDGQVSLPDLIVLADSWLTNDGGDLDGNGGTDLADFAILANHWGEGCGDNSWPVARDINAGYVNQGESKTITLTATDTDGDMLCYRIDSLPAYGTLTTMADVTITAVPFTLTTNQVKYVQLGSPTGTDSFLWSVSDPVAPPCGGMDTATVTVLTMVSPTADAQQVSAVQYEWQSISLTAADDGNPNPPGKLKYIITSLPASGTLIDPTSGAGFVTRVPWTLSSWGSVVVYGSESTGQKTFNFKATDGYSDSQTATVTVNVAAHPKDFLAFNRPGTVTFANHVNYDIKPGFALRFWMRTREAFCKLASKRGDTGPGYVVDLVGGRPRGRLYDSTGLVREVVYPFRIDDGTWHYVTIELYTVEGVKYFAVEADDWTVPLEITGGDFSNAAPLIVGMFNGDIDKLRVFADMDFSSLSGIPMEWAGRNDLTETQLGFGLASAVRFMCNEGTGTTITDNKLGLTGTISDINHVRWYPWMNPFIDVSVLQRHYGGGR
ncbi:MAG: hypothetical protein LLF76_02260 [Planctomycetaceae bacterium]|nr:hypothetical protein [Planctomycetaceae bacterium]